MNALLLTLYLAAAGDAATTCTGLSRGYGEINPLYGVRPTCARVVAVKAATLVPITLYVRGRPTKGKRWALGISIGVTSFSVTWNVYQLRRDK